MRRPRAVESGRPDGDVHVLRPHPRRAGGQGVRRSAGAAPRPRADRGLIGRGKRRHPRRGGGPRRLAAPARLAAEDRRQRHGPGSLAAEDCAGHLGAAGASVAFVRAAAAGRLAVAPACLATRRPGRREYGRPPPLPEGKRPAVAAARHAWRWGAPVLGGAAAAQPARDHDRAAAVLPGDGGHAEADAPAERSCDCRDSPGRSGPPASRSGPPAAPVPDLGGRGPPLAEQAGAGAAPGGAGACGARAGRRAEHPRGRRREGKVLVGLQPRGDLGDAAARGAAAGDPAGCAQQPARGEQGQEDEIRHLHDVRCPGASG
mmetsp:Transcript_44446/g.97042  ORF Transcript_44446/g.97042 Transcript_44446/m.97042 type:complete len:317 (+) Transcript_44446:217-1167(+)